MKLWVRETWAPHPDYGDQFIYRADRGVEYDVDSWRPSIHMPRRASRIWLEIVSVRVERLKDISEADARAEGAHFHDGRCVGHSGWRHDYKDVYATARESFAVLWESIHGPGSWDENPFVWCIKFKRILP